LENRLFDGSSGVGQVFGGILAELHLVELAGGLIRGEFLVAEVVVFGGVFVFFGAHFAIDGLAGEVGAALSFGAEIAVESAAAGTLGVGIGGIEVAAGHGFSSLPKKSEFRIQKQKSKMKDKRDPSEGERQMSGMRMASIGVEPLP
jgi:hypothetical protein